MFVNINDSIIMVIIEFQGYRLSNGSHIQNIELIIFQLVSNDSTRNNNISIPIAPIKYR